MSMTTKQKIIFDAAVSLTPMVYAKLNVEYVSVEQIADISILLAHAPYSKSESIQPETSSQDVNDY